ncbi:hypothetical protein L2D37_25560 [Vibrio harveyi]|uniref:hypothetical protein n=2 Tax=Vibrio harveyi group TaxID=717610 RepID=UPI003BB71347
MMQSYGCGYTGYDFGAHYPDSTCINGYLWDMDSGFSDDSGEHYLDIGGDIPCPRCNLSKWVSWMAEDWEDCGYESLEHPLTTKMVKNSLRGLPSNIRRRAMRHWRSGRRMAIKEAMQEG